MTVKLSLTRHFRQTVVERVRRDPEFAKGLLDEAATLFLNGEGEAARLVLRELVKATVGFEALAAKTGRPAKSFHRMLSKNGNPTMDNLAAILGVVRKDLGVEMKARAIQAALPWAHDPPGRSQQAVRPYPVRFHTRQAGRCRADDCG